MWLGLTAAGAFVAGLVAMVLVRRRPARLESRRTVIIITERTFVSETPSTQPLPDDEEGHDDEEYDDAG